VRSLCKCFIHHLSSSADTAPKAPSGLYIAQSFMPVHTCIGLARTIYIRCTYGIFGREITKYMVIYGVYIRFWPTLHMQHQTPDQLYEISSNAALYITRNWATPFFVTPRDGSYGLLRRPIRINTPLIRHTRIIRKRIFAILGGTLGLHQPPSNHHELSPQPPEHYNASW